MFFGKQNEALASIEKRPRPYHKKARQSTVLERENGLLRALIGFGQNAVSNRKFRAALDAERGGPAV